MNVELLLGGASFPKKRLELSVLFAFAGYVYMNGDLGKGSTAVYATNAAALDAQTLGAQMAVISTGPGGAATLPLAAMPTMTTLVPAQALAAATEYALVNGNMLTAADTAQQQQQTVVDTTFHYADASSLQGGLTGQQTTVTNENHGGGGGGSDMHGGDTGIPLDRLKKLLTAQLEYYFSM